MIRSILVAIATMMAFLLFATPSYATYPQTELAGNVPAATTVMVTPAYVSAYRLPTAAEIARMDRCDVSVFAINSLNPGSAEGIKCDVRGSDAVITKGDRTWTVNLASGTLAKVKRHIANPRSGETLAQVCSSQATIWGYVARYRVSIPRTCPNGQSGLYQAGVFIGCDLPVERQTAPASTYTYQPRAPEQQPSADNRLAAYALILGSERAKVSTKTPNSQIVSIENARNATGLGKTALGGLGAYLAAGNLPADEVSLTALAEARADAHAEGGAGGTVTGRPTGDGETPGSDDRGNTGRDTGNGGTPAATQGGNTGTNVTRRGTGNGQTAAGTGTVGLAPQPRLTSTTTGRRGTGGAGTGG